jgi:hypothetical protein
MKNEFTPTELDKVVDTARERRRQWMERGLITASHPSPGQGSRAIFTRTDVYGVALFAKLLDIGLKGELASECVNRFVSWELTQRVGYIAFQFVIRNGKRVFVSTPWWAGDGPMNIETREKMTLGIKGGGQKKEWDGIHVINCVKLRKDVDAKLKQL